MPTSQEKQGLAIKKRQDIGTAQFHDNEVRTNKASDADNAPLVRHCAVRFGFPKTGTSAVRCEGVCTSGVEMTLKIMKILGGKKDFVS